MQVKNPTIKLDDFGKPTLYFQAIPETSLEQDALKALGFHIEMGKQGRGSLMNGHSEALKVLLQISEGEFHVYTHWQVDGPIKRG